MGLISGVLMLPLAPVRGVVWVGEQIAEEADRQLDPAARIRRELAALELELERGNLSQQEFEQREDELIEQLRVEAEERDRVGD